MTLEELWVMTMNASSAPAPASRLLGEEAAGPSSTKSVHGHDGSQFGAIAEIAEMRNQRAWPREVFIPVSAMVPLPGQRRAMMWRHIVRPYLEIVLVGDHVVVGHIVSGQDAPPRVGPSKKAPHLVHVCEHDAAVEVAKLSFGRRHL